MLKSVAIKNKNIERNIVAINIHILYMYISQHLLKSCVDHYYQIKSNKFPITVYLKKQNG